MQNHQNAPPAPNERAQMRGAGRVRGGCYGARDHTLSCGSRVANHQRAAFLLIMRAFGASNARAL